jgi:hypothetical protein
MASRSSERPSGAELVVFLGAVSFAACTGPAQVQVEVPSGAFCEALPPPSGDTVEVTPAQTAELPDIVSHLRPGETLLLGDGTYALDGATLHVVTDGVTIRSASGDPSAVVLDGSYASGDCFLINADDVTLAELTVRRAQHHPIHVAATPERGVSRTRIYRAAVLDPGQQGIKINPDDGRTHFVDDGEVACSSIVLTDEGRARVWEINESCYTGGVDGHGASGWVVRDSRIEGFFCAEGESEHAIHFWTGSRDTVVERNVLVDNARAVGFGMLDEGAARTYDDDPCPGSAGYVCHYGGVVRNNFIVGTRPELFASSMGFDCGICLWSACGAEVYHNTILSTGDLFSSIEWRFEASRVTVRNNLASHAMRERDGATAELGVNAESAVAADFWDAAAADLHLAPEAQGSIDRGEPLAPGVCDQDIDGDARGQTPDLGADERI